MAAESRATVHKPLFPIIGLGTVVAAVAMYYHFVMIDQFVVGIMALLIAITLPDVNGRRFWSNLFSRRSLALAAFVVLYLITINPSLSNTGGEINERRLYYEIAALLSYLIVLPLFRSLKTLVPATVFLTMVVGGSLAAELGQYALGINQISNPNIYAYHTLILVPFLHVVWARRPWATLGILLAFAALTIVVFESRTVFVALLLYVLVFTAWPWIAKRRMRLAFCSAAFIGFIVTPQYLYIANPTFFEQEAVLTVNQAVTSKTTTNRTDIWTHLIDEIQSELVWGHCANCSTEFYVSPGMTRHLSSHNTYLEVVFRSGVVGLAVFVLVLFQVVAPFFSGRSSPFSRVGVAYFCASIWTASSYEFILFSFLSANLMFWIAMGLTHALIERFPGRVRAPQSSVAIPFGATRLRPARPAVVATSAL